MRVLLVHNPESGEQRQDSDTLLTLIRGAGHEVRPWSMKNPDFERVLDDDVDLVVAAGGDGTVRSVASALVGRGLPLTILPLGTANNIASSMGIGGDPESLVASWASAVRRAADVGVASAPWGESHFFESVGIGLVADVLRTERSSSGPVVQGALRESKVRSGRELFSDVLSGLAPREAKVTIDGRTLKGDYLLVAVMKARSIGPNLVLAPAAKVDDGQLHVVLVSDTERQRLLRALAGDADASATEGELPSFTARRVSIEWHGDLAHLDDELWPEPRSLESPGDASPISAGALHRVDVSILPGALEVLVPRTGVR